MQIRTTWPEEGNPFYNTTDVGGYSQCCYGNPTCEGRNVLANCVGYACGRFNEIIGSMKYPKFKVDAESFIWVAQTYYPELPITSYPTVGGIMVFKKIGEDYGHVFIVEEIIDDNTIYTSESAWKGKPFFNAHRYKNSNWSMSGYEFLGCIGNPAITPTPTPTPTTDKYYQVVGGSLLLLNENYASIGSYPTGTIVKYIRDGYNLNYQGRTYHYYYVKVTTDGKQGYMAQDYLQPYNQPTPQPTPDIQVGTRVKTIGMGKSSCYGDTPNAMSGLQGVIGNIQNGTPYPYRVDDNDGALGWYKKEDLQIL